MDAPALKSTSRRGGFTLLEVLITLALIALLTGVLVVGGNSMLADRPKTPEELFWSMVTEVRKDALFNNRDVRVSLDKEKGEFVALSQGVETRLSFVPKETSELEFLAPKTSGNFSAILIAGQLVETQTIPFVTFYSDGTCSPFRVQLKNRTGVKALEIDPWTCAPMLTTEPPR